MDLCVSVFLVLCQEIKSEQGNRLQEGHCSVMVGCKNESEQKQENRRTQTLGVVFFSLCTGLIESTKQLSGSSTLQPCSLCLTYRRRNLK